MLLEINYRNRRRTIYKCDRCGREVFAAEIHGIFEKNNKGHVVRTKDLCKRCYRFMQAFFRKEV